MSTNCYAMVRGRVARFTRLDARGIPVEGESSVIVTSGLAKVTINERSETQSTDLIRSDRDDPRILLRGKTQTMGYSADIDLCGVDPELISLLTGMPLVANAVGDVVGNDAKMKMPVANFAMEIWSKLDQPVNGYTYGYTVFPRLRGGRLGGFSFGSNAVDFTITAARTTRASRWGIGPYSLRRSDAGWDIAPCAPMIPLTKEGGFGEIAFGEEPFGGYVYPIFDRLGTEIGSHTHWRNFLLDWAPSPTCGATPLYDAVDNGSASDPISEDVIDGQFVLTGDDVLDGGYA